MPLKYITQKVNIFITVKYLLTCILVEIIRNVTFQYAVRILLELVKVMDRLQLRISVELNSSECHSVFLRNI